jgi:hypothetical protein
MVYDSRGLILLYLSDVLSVATTKQKVLCIEGVLTIGFRTPPRQRQPHQCCISYRIALKAGRRTRTSQVLNHMNSPRQISTNRVAVQRDISNIPK